MATWHSLSSARQFWKDAPADDVVLASYLEAARSAVIAYAPARPTNLDGTPLLWTDPAPVELTIEAGDMLGADAAAGVTGTISLALADGLVRLVAALDYPEGTDIADLLGMHTYATAPGFEIAANTLSTEGTIGEGVFGRQSATARWDVNGTLTFIDAYPASGLGYSTEAMAGFLFYAPSAYFAPIPTEWRLAQIMQARNVWNAGKAAPSGGFDGSDYGLSTFPLDWAVKQLLRPQRGIGAIA